jgi:quinol monooxygenase YgiN
MPPLQMEISTLDINSRLSPNGVMLSTSIRTLPGSELAMRSALETLAAETKATQGSRVFTMAVNQDPEDRQNFFMLQRFPSVQAMSGHQQSDTFKVSSIYSNSSMLVGVLRTKVVVRLLAPQRSAARLHRPAARLCQVLANARSW